MDIRTAIIDFAISQIKETENPPGSNKIKYNDWYYEVGHNYHNNTAPYAWCGTFVSYIYHFGTMDFDWMLDKEINDCIYYVPKVQNLLVKKGLRVKWEDAKAGDIIIFDWQKDGFEDHIALVNRVEGDYIYTIEGNTSGAGSQSNGGIVLPKRRHKSLVEGIYNVLDV